MFRTLAKTLVVTAMLTGVQTLTVEPVLAIEWPWSKAPAEKPASPSKAPASFDKSSMIGNWVGQLKTEDAASVPVRLLVRPVGEDRLALTMIYGGQRACMLNGKFEKESKGVCRFSLKSGGGAFCDKLAQLTLTLSSPNQLAYTVSGANGQTVESGVLQK